jgi:hypothetical protein
MRHIKPSINDMKHIKPSTNVKYIIESSNGFLWEEEYNFDLLAEAIKELEFLKTSLPNGKFRLIRSEWKVIEE